MLELSEDQFHVAAREAKLAGDHAFIDAGLPKIRHPVGKRTEARRQGRARDMSSMRFPGVAKVDKTRVEPVFSTSLSQELEEPFLEAAGDDPGGARRGIVA